jgi:hypothetical protein
MIYEFGMSKTSNITCAREAVDVLAKKKDPEDERIIVVFSFNPLDEEMPYETGYYAG